MAAYILVANSDLIRVFRADGAGRILEHERFANPVSEPTKAHTTLDLVATLPPQHRAEQNCYMAKVVTAYLCQIRDSGEASAFILAAPAPLLLSGAHTARRRRAHVNRGGGRRLA